MLKSLPGGIGLVVVFGHEELSEPLGGESLSSLLEEPGETSEKAGTKDKVSAILMTGSAKG